MAEPIVIAHRGASAYRPENTLAAFELACEQGADLIETDVVLTRDGVLVCSHDLVLDHQTNIADLPEFGGRQATHQVDGKDLTGWFVCDLTLAEVKQLRVRVRRTADGQADRPTVAKDFDDQFDIPTLAEMIALCKQHETGLLIELKLPSFHQSEMRKSLALESLHDLDRAGIKMQADLPITIQSFETDDLKLLRQELDQRQCDFGICRLMNKMPSEAELADAASYANAIGPSMTLVMDEHDTGKGGTVTYSPTPVVAAATEKGLDVFVYTFRADRPPFPRDAIPQIRGRGPETALTEMQHHLAAGVDGLITDNPDLGRRAVDAYQKSNHAK